MSSEPQWEYATAIKWPGHSEYDLGTPDEDDWTPYREEAERLRKYQRGQGYDSVLIRRNARVEILYDEV